MGSSLEFTLQAVRYDWEKNRRRIPEEYERIKNEIILILLFMRPPLDKREGIKKKRPL
jgi:hypothetical protein